MDKIQEAVEKFNNENGNRQVTLKELVIFFNTERKEDIKEIKTALSKLPCKKHMDDMAVLKTTIKHIKLAVVIGIPLVIAIIEIGLKVIKW
jgi:hypothetical protein